MRRLHPQECARQCTGTNVVQEVCERMTKELTASAPSAMMIKVVAPPDNIILTVGAKTLPLRGSVVPSNVSVARRSLAKLQEAKPKKTAGPW